jgi:hypothetical protein
VVQTLLESWTFVKASRRGLRRFVPFERMFELADSSHEFCSNSVQKWFKSYGSRQGRNSRAPNTHTKIKRLFNCIFESCSELSFYLKLYFRTWNSMSQSRSRKGILFGMQSWSWRFALLLLRGKAFLPIKGTHLLSGFPA